MIKKLDEKTIGQIAAGEVIERPLNIIKELVENSIDAKSTRIIVQIENGGLDCIVVTDNGTGININDLPLVFFNHATSKIDNINDLMSVQSFGFRGEALASIGLVSKVELITKTQNDNIAHKINDIFGKISDISDSTLNIGTSIKVSNLFDNMPVRKKFLKGSTVESNKIYDIITKIALSYPNISIKYIQDNNEKFSSSGDNNLKNIIYTLYGKEIYDNIIEVDYNYRGIKIKGYIGNTKIFRNNRNDEIFFVNNRYIKSQIITKAIEDAYKQYLMQHKFPFVILNINMGDNIVDVNVHPQKLEVRFSDDSIIYTGIYESIYNNLKNTSLIHNEHFDNNNIYETASKKNYVDFINNNNLYENKVYKNDEVSIENIKSIKSLIEEKHFENNKNIDDIINKTNFDSDKTNDNNDNTIKNETNENNKLNINNFFNNYKYIGQLFNTYLLIEYNNELYMIDQHAAHEKIYYEKFIKELNEQKVYEQKIMPIVITLTNNQYEIVKENLTLFKKSGFSIDLFGDKDIIVNTVPYNILNIGKKELLMEMIDEFSNDKNLTNYDSINDKIASISCKKAVKGNNILLDVEAKHLIEDLFKLDNPYNCPHGRPTIIKFNKYELEKKFKRIV